MSDEGTPAALEPEPDRSIDERAALIQLLGRISHDLRGPAGITSGVLDELEQQGNPSQTQLFAMARRGLAGVLRIAERLEMVSQLESGALQLDPSPVEIAHLLKSAVDEASLLQKRKAVRTTLDVDSALRATCDAHWLRATIVEIIANAIRHAKTSVRVSAAREDARTKIVVEDDGSGFSDEALEAISAPRFSRVSQRLGLGLSLSIARDVVASHQGTLTFGRASTAGGSTRGARVEITLP